LSKIISNATPLIYLAKIKRLSLLQDTFDEVFIPEEAKIEVVDEGKKLKKIDANLVEKEISEGWIKVQRTDKYMRLPIELDKGKIATLTLALDLEIKEVLIDEVSARTAAEILGLVPRGTIFVLLKALKMEKIDFDEFLEILDSLLEEGFRLKEEVYLKAIEEAKHAISKPI